METDQFVHARFGLPPLRSLPACDLHWSVWWLMGVDAMVVSEDSVVVDGQRSHQSHYLQVGTGDDL